RQRDSPIRPHRNRLREVRIAPYKDAQRVQRTDEIVGSWIIADRVRWRQGRRAASAQHQNGQHDQYRPAGDYKATHARGHHISLLSLRSSIAPRRPSLIERHIAMSFFCFIAESSE